MQTLRHYLPALTLMITAAIFSPDMLARPDTGYLAPMSVPGATTVSVDEARRLYDEGAVFIDVRNARLFARRHIPGSHHLDMKYTFSRETLADVADKDQPIVIYSSGVRCGRAYRASRLAIEWGYTNVNYFRGGIVDWRDLGFPLQAISTELGP